jgi:histidinol phosphatase-like PHP family hydrolase
MDASDAALTDAKRLSVDYFRRRDMAEVCAGLELESCEMGSRYDKAARILGVDSEADYLVGSVT